MSRVFSSFAVFFLACGAASVQGAELLSLKESVERAVANNSRLLVAKKDISISKAQLRQARSLYYPKVNLNLDYVRFRNETLSVTPPELGGVILEPPPVDDSEKLYVGRVGFLQTLYAGGRMAYTNRLSKANAKRAENNYETVKKEVEFSTVDSFYRLLALNQKKLVYQDMIERASRLANGTDNRHARLSISRLQAELRRDLRDLDAHREDVRFRYLQAMGVELFSDADAQGGLDVKSFQEDLQTVVAWAKENRVELKETVIQQEADRLSVNLSMAERYPVFLLGGGYEVRHEDFPLEDSNWNAVLSMNIPVFDGFSSRGRVKESKYRADQTQLRRIELEDNVEMEVRSSYGDYTHWRAEVAEREKDVQQLEKSRSSYGSGRVPETLEYLKWVLDARLGVIDARQELCLSHARLIKAVGRSVLDEE